MKKIIIWLALAVFSLAPVAPIMAATPITKLTPQEALLRKKLTQVKIKQKSTKAKIKVNTSQVKKEIKKVKKQRAAVIKKRATVKTKVNAIKK